MEKVFKFTIDQVPPSTNHLYTNGSHGRRVLVQEGRKYKKHILSTCKKAVDGYAFVDKSHWEAEITYYLSSSFNLRDVNNMDKLIVACVKARDRAKETQRRVVLARDILGGAQTNT